VACLNLSLMLYLPFIIKVPVYSELYCMHLFRSHVILSVKIVVFWVMTVHILICGWLVLLEGLSIGGSRLCKMLVTTYHINGAIV
jgi:hypothetical protein